jgi:hypothetical protein
MCRSRRLFARRWPGAVDSRAPPCRDRARPTYHFGRFLVVRPHPLHTSAVASRARPARPAFRRSGRRFWRGVPPVSPPNADPEARSSKPPGAAAQVGIAEDMHPMRVVQGGLLSKPLEVCAQINSQAGLCPHGPGRLMRVPNRASLLGLRRRTILPAARSRPAGGRGFPDRSGSLSRRRSRGRRQRTRTPCLCHSLSGSRGSPG